MAGVVKGLGDYGNAFGVPTVGGESFCTLLFAHSMVNAFALGTGQTRADLLRQGEGVGNDVHLCRASWS
jgi:phosphoribosylformylglycinamidine synthase